MLNLRKNDNLLYNNFMWVTVEVTEAQLNSGRFLHGDQFWSSMSYARGVGVGVGGNSALSNSWWHGMVLVALPSKQATPHFTASIERQFWGQVSHGLFHPQLLRVASGFWWWKPLRRKASYGTPNTFLVIAHNLLTFIHFSNLMFCLINQ